MKTLTRIILAFVSVVASYYFNYWILPLISEAFNVPAIHRIVPILIAIIIGFFVWKKSKTITYPWWVYIILGGIIGGSIGFVLVFFGAIIFSPSSGNGPLLAFITGPLGFLIGIIGGGIYGYKKEKNEEYE